MENNSVFNPKNSYVVSVGKPYTFWKEELKNPPDRFSPQHVYLYSRSESWSSCICSCLDSRIPRFPFSGAPEDGRLRDLGKMFDLSVFRGDWSVSLGIIDKVEARAIEILKDMGVWGG